MVFSIVVQPDKYTYKINPSKSTINKIHLQDEINTKWK